jgi:pentatricopeptide repeat protein
MIKLHLNTRSHRAVADTVRNSHVRTVSAPKCYINFTSIAPRLSGHRHIGPHSSAVRSNPRKDDLNSRLAKWTAKPEDEYLRRVFESTVKSSRGPVSGTRQRSSAISVSPTENESVNSQIADPISSQNTQDRAAIKRKDRAFNSAQRSPISSRVKTALDSSNSQWMLLLWQEALSNGNRDELSKSSPGSHGDGVRKPNTSKTPSVNENPRASRIISYSLCNQFLAAFMALKDPRNAIQVWNYMASTRGTPSQASWNAMLDGCRVARDIKSLNDVWGKMQASGIHPDVGCWTTKISALAQAGSFSQSVATLREMGTTWLKAADAKRKSKSISQQDTKSKILQKNTAGDENDKNEIVKPSIEALNAALSYVPKHIDEREIDALVSWARGFELEANIITYNSLVRAHVNANRNERALQLLEEMDVNGVPPDVITYTIVLAGLLRNSESMSSADSTEIIGRVLAEMEGNGIEANAFSYGTIVHGLLKHHSNVSAARAILDHMISKGLKASPHIFTILAIHYFETRPVDLVALDELWDQIVVQKVPVDHIFYDIMIKGYAEAREINRMAATLRAASLHRKVPGWDVLVAALSAFLASGETSRAKQLVRDTETTDRTSSPIRRMSRSQADFEDIARDLRQQESDL